MDFALFSNYERQVEALLAGHIDVAWDTPLAHVRVQRRTDGRSSRSPCATATATSMPRSSCDGTRGIRSPHRPPGQDARRRPRDSTRRACCRCTSCSTSGRRGGRAPPPVRHDVGKHATRDERAGGAGRPPRGTRPGGRRRRLVWVSEQAAGPSTRRRSRSSGRHPGSITACCDALPTLRRRRRRFPARAFAMRGTTRHRRLMELEGLKEWMPAARGGLCEPAGGARRAGRW